MANPIEKLAEKFKGLVGATRREAMLVRAAEAPAPPDPDAEVRNELGSALDDARLKPLVKWLEQNMERMVITAHANHLVSAEVNYNLGFEAGLRFVRDRLVKW